MGVKENYGKQRTHQARFENSTHESPDARSSVTSSHLRLPNPRWTLTGRRERRRAATNVLIAFRGPSHESPSYKKMFCSAGNTSVILSPESSSSALQTCTGALSIR